MTLTIAIPIIIQNLLTNLVSMADNIMVGQLGTNQMSGVAIINQLFFVFNLLVFGGMSGAGLFSAQYFGQKNHNGNIQLCKKLSLHNGYWNCTFCYF